MPTKTIRQTIVIPAEPDEVYRALTTAKGHAAFTGATARISPRVGGRFSVWGGYIHGKNLQLVPGHKIVQAWRPAEETWPHDHDSTVTFRLTKVARGTRIDFIHSGVPEDHAGHLSKGWHESYWRPLRAYFRTRS